MGDLKRLVTWMEELVGISIRIPEKVYLPAVMVMGWFAYRYIFS